MSGPARRTDSRSPQLQRAAASLFASLVLLVFPATARAQFAAGVTLSTNEMFRGQSISDDDPTAGLSLSYDDQSGLFAGLGASMAVDGEGPRLSSATQYAGYAIRKGENSFELGVVHRYYARVSDEDYRKGYVEAFVGVTRKRTSVRVFASPNAYKDRRLTFYGEVNSMLAQVEGWSLNGHAGLSLVPSHSGGGSGALRRYPDWKLDVSRQAGKFFVSLGVAGSSYATYSKNEKPRVFATLSRAF